jgi:hypothetical protein
MNDGVVYEVHKEVGSELVKGSYKNGSSWVTPYTLYRSHSSGFLQIESDFSPSLEYHAGAGVEYLVTGYADYEFSGYGMPIIYWRYTNAYYTPASNPSMLTRLGSNDLNSSFTPVAVVQNGVNKLFIFWTESGTSSPNGLVIRFKKGDITGNFGDGTISWGNTSYSVSGAYTDHKIDGFFDTNTEEIVIVFRNYSSGEIDLAISSDFGANWTLETGVDDVSGAPSIVNLD